MNTRVTSNTNNHGWNGMQQQSMKEWEESTGARERNRLERRRSGGIVDQEGPAATEATGGIAYIHGVLQFVESALEDAEAEEQTDQDHHQYQARAQHAHSAPAAHLLQPLLFSPPAPVRSEKREGRVCSRRTGARGKWWYPRNPHFFWLKSCLRGTRFSFKHNFSWGEFED